MPAAGRAVPDEPELDDAELDDVTDVDDEDTPRRSADGWSLKREADESFRARRGAGPSASDEPAVPTRGARLVDSVPPPRPVLPRVESAPSSQPTAGRRFAAGSLPDDYVGGPARRSAASPSQWSPLSPAEADEWPPAKAAHGIITPVRAERTVASLAARPAPADTAAPEPVPHVVRSGATAARRALPGAPAQPTGTTPTHRDLAVPDPPAEPTRLGWVLLALLIVVGLALAVWFLWFRPF